MAKKLSPGFQAHITKAKLRRLERIKASIGSSLDLGGEPYIYSNRHNVTGRQRSPQHKRNQQLHMMLKSFFASYIHSDIPVVLFVTFFVSPRDKKISIEDLRSERVPATHTYEILEYLLSLLEAMKDVCFRSYRQVVKIDCEKYYSDKPRIMMKYMHWDGYVELQNQNSSNTQAKDVS